MVYDTRLPIIVYLLCFFFWAADWHFLVAFTTEFGVGMVWEEHGGRSMVLVAKIRRGYRLVTSYVQTGFEWYNMWYLRCAFCFFIEKYNFIQGSCASQRSTPLVSRVAWKPLSSFTIGYKYDHFWTLHPHWLSIHFSSTARREALYFFLFQVSNLRKVVTSIESILGKRTTSLSRPPLTTPQKSKEKLFSTLDNLFRFYSNRRLVSETWSPRTQSFVHSMEIVLSTFRLSMCAWLSSATLARQEGVSLEL